MKYFVLMLVITVSISMHASELNSHIIENKLKVEFDSFAEIENSNAYFAGVYWLTTKELNRQKKAGAFIDSVFINDLVFAFYSRYKYALNVVDSLSPMPWRVAIYEKNLSFIS